MENTKFVDIAGVEFSLNLSRISRYEIEGEKFILKSDPRQYKTVKVAGESFIVERVIPWGARVTGKRYQTIVIFK